MKKALATISTLSVAGLLATGCTINVGQPDQQQPQQQNQQQNNDQAQNQDNNQNQQQQNGADEMGVKKSVGAFDITPNGIQVINSNGEQYVVVDARVENIRGEHSESLTDSAFLTNNSGQKATCQYSPLGVTDVNYAATPVQPQSYYTHGVLVFKLTEGGPYTLTIENGGQTVTWTLNG
jgi:hypothetical protein